MVESHAQHACRSKPKIYVVARTPASALMIYVVWICIPIITVAIASLFSGTFQKNVPIATLFSWLVFGGSFVSHWRTRTAVAFDDDGIIFREPSSLEFLGQVRTVRIPWNSVLTMRVVQVASPRGREHSALDVSCVGSLCDELGVGFSRTDCESHCTVLERTPDVVKMRFTFETWKWEDECVGLFQSRLDQGEGSPPKAEG